MVRAGLLVATLACGAGCEPASAPARAEQSVAVAPGSSPTCAPPPSGAIQEAGSSGQWLIDSGVQGRLVDGDKLTDDPDAAEVFVDFDGSVFWNGAVVTPQQLRDAVSTHTRDDPARPIQVEWHRLARRGQVQDAVSAINAAGAEPLLIERPAAPPLGAPVLIRRDGSRIVGYTKPAPDVPALIGMLENSYPLAAALEKREGDTILAMCIGPDGRARDVRVVNSSGHADLDEAAVKGMMSLQFHPACDDVGKPIDWCDPPFPLTVGWKIPR